MITFHIDELNLTLRAWEKSVPCIKIFDKISGVLKGFLRRGLKTSTLLVILKNFIFGYMEVKVGEKLLLITD